MENENPKYIELEHPKKMYYYKLNSGFDGDVVKNCGLTIDEVDHNFYELEAGIYDLAAYIDKIPELEARIRALEEKPYVTYEGIYSRSMLDKNIVANQEDWVSLMATTYSEGANPHIARIGGKIGNKTVDGETGNHFGVAIIPFPDMTECDFPHAKWYINDNPQGNLWQTISHIPVGWTTALYIYPKVERIYNHVVVSMKGISDLKNTITIKIEWDENNTETYTYIVEQDVELL